MFWLFGFRVRVNPNIVRMSIVRIVMRIGIYGRSLTTMSNIMIIILLYSGVACNWCVSLADLILVLTVTLCGAHSFVMY